MTKYFPKSEKKADQILLIFCLIVLVLAIGIGHLRTVGTFSVESDFYGVYAVQAEKLLKGQPYTYQHNPPGYCLLLAGMTFLIGNTFIAGKIISAVSLALLGGVIYLLLKTIIHYQLALIVSILSIVTLFPSSFLAAMDIVSTLVMLLPILVFLRPSPLTLKTVFFCGVLSGLAYLFRTNAIFIPIGILSSLLIFNFKQDNLIQSLIKTSFFLGGFILIISPWMFYNWHMNGSFLANSAYLQIAANFYHPQGDNYITSLKEMESQFDSLKEVIFYHPFQVIKKYLGDVLLFNIPRLFIPLSLIEKVPLILIFPLLWVGTGLILLINDLKKKDDLIKQKILAFLLINFLGYLLLGLVSFHRRYFFFIYPCVFLFKIYPLYRLNFLKITLFNATIKRTITTVLLLSLFGGVSLAAGIETHLTLTNEPKYLLPIAEFLEASSSPQEIMIIRKPHLAYLAGFTATFPLANTANEYLIKAHKLGAKYVVYSDYEASLWSGLNALKYPQFLPPSWQLVYHHKPTNTLIYKIK